MKKPSGVAVMYALIILTITMLMVGDITTSLLRNILQMQESIGGRQAHGAAQDTQEEAMSEITSHGLGYENPAGTLDLFDRNSDGVPDVYGTYEIWARAKKVGWRAGFVAGDAYGTYGACGSMSADLCIAPVPGTGNAGDGCDFTDTTQGWAQPTSPSTPTTGLNNDCNWNKLHYGEVVSFPLYYEDAGCTGGICNLAELGLGTFTLRVRTPDTDGDGMRETLGWADISDLYGPVVVNWEITGDCDTDGVPPEEAEESCWMIGITDPYDPSGGTFIQASDINSTIVTENEVLSEDDYGEMHTGSTQIILDFLTSDENGPTDREILNPLLTLSVVSPLQEPDLSSIPYLEYQIQVDKPISDNKSSIHTIGKAEGKLGTYVWPMLDYLGIAENPLVQFVIQN